jgi:hypothetical protein
MKDWRGEIGGSRKSHDAVFFPSPFARFVGLFFLLLPLLEWQTKITRINVKASARVFSKWKSMEFYCVFEERRPGAAIRTPLFHPFRRRASRRIRTRPPLFFLSRIYAAFLSENTAFVSKTSCSVLRNDRNPITRARSLARSLAPASLLYSYARRSPYLRDTNERSGDVVPARELREVFAPVN